MIEIEHTKGRSVRVRGRCTRGRGAARKGTQKFSSKFNSPRLLIRLHGRKVIVVMLSTLKLDLTC